MAKDENKGSEIRGEEQESVDQRLPVWRPQDADREYFRYETKKRIQHYSVPPQTIFRPAKPTPTIRDAEHKRVAVYARVSTKSKEQVSSIENQTKYYTEKIAKTPNWDLAEIYSDEGKSGTSKKWRPEFKRMLEDASKKKMDLIVCASVSRFARNISDLIEEVRKLRTTNPSNPVGVYFETEDLYTLDPNINERLQMQGLFAEWESGNKSRRMILSYDQRICTGQFPLSDLLGLRHTIEGGFIIEEEEAKTVKYIFLATLCGYTAEEIAEVLTDKQRPTLRGRTEWTPSMVKAIMENERRWGDLEVRKRVVIDYKEKVTAKNDGLREGAYIPHYHEGIVSPEIARAAHMMRASRYKFGSVPDVYVIDSGALKGFVSISPTWSGIDNRAFQDISRQVYNEDEFCELQRRANIMNGRTHSNVVSMTLNDYRVAPGVMFMTRSDPQLTFSQRSMKLNAVCWEKLGQQKYVEFLYHPVLEVIAVRSCNATNPNAVLWDETKKSGLQLCTSAFSNAVYDTLTDSNHVVSDYTFSSNLSDIVFTTNGDTLTITAKTAPAEPVTISASKNNIRKGVIVWSDGHYGPSLATEWSEKNLPLTPDAVNEKSTKNVWWKCNTCGYEWKAVVKARVKGGMCPVCAERAVLQGYNDLGTTDPHLLSEWDYEKNSKWTPSNVSRNSMKVVWWKCGAGHSYRAKITDRTIEQKGCPQCEAEFQQALPQMLIMMYGAQNGITVKSNSNSELGMRLVAYLPELHCAVDIAGATVTEKREQSVKAHICQSNRLSYYLIKRTTDTSQMAAEIKTLFIRNHIYLHTDSEHDVQVLRERFLEWKNRNACKLNGKY